MVSIFPHAARRLRARSTMRPLIQNFPVAPSTAVDMKDKPRDQPSGRHPFDRVCAGRNIVHRLIRPYRPQTNGLVERFNRRIAEAIGREPTRGIAHRLFTSHEDRGAFLNRFGNLF
jgi:transposase InsO family protein